MIRTNLVRELGPTSRVRVILLGLVVVHVGVVLVLHEPRVGLLLHHVLLLLRVHLLLLLLVVHHLLHHHKLLLLLLLLLIFVHIRIFKN